MNYGTLAYRLTSLLVFTVIYPSFCFVLHVVICVVDSELLFKVELLRKVT